VRRPAILVSCLALAACAGRQSALDPAAIQAGALFDLLVLMICVGSVMYALVIGFLAFGLMHRRAAKNDETASGSADHGLTRALVAWAAIIVTGLTVLATTSFLLDRHLAAPRARNVIPVRIIAQQWWWRIAYRDPASQQWVETANELHLPVGSIARVELGSNDVIHSFWIPNLAGKLDVVPGRTNRLDLSPTRIGRFRGQCAEFCGQQHAHMALDVTVESPEQFAAWLANVARPAAPPAESSGMQVFAQRCAACHAIRGTSFAGRAGPDLTHLASRERIAAGTLPFNRGNLLGWIRQPQTIKPGTLMPAVPLDAKEGDALGRYLEELR